jgi:ATP synthase protein I
MSAPGPNHDERDPLVASARRKGERRRRWQREGEPSTARRLAEIGVLGWVIVTPMLIGVFIGRWLDGAFASGIFWTAPLLIIGLVIGAWSAWKWINAQ